MEPGFISVWVDMGASHRACFVGKTRGEGLVEPEIIPPLHGDQITEPHVAELVLNDDTEEGQFGDGHVLLTAHDVVGVSDAADIFHGAVFVVGAHHVVNLGERISRTKVPLIEVQRRFCDAEHELMTKVLDERLSDEDALRHIHRVVIFEHLIWASADGVEIC